MGTTEPLRNLPSGLDTNISLYQILGVEPDVSLFFHDRESLLEDLK
jgi:hypothetical protein